MTTKPDRILWRGRGRVESRSAVEVTDAELALVNRFVVGAPATADDVYLCEAQVCNDVVDFFDTQFTQNALRQVANLLPGVNVMRNHQECESEDLPIGRVYAAGVRTDVDGVTWVWARFYWDKGTEDSDGMARKIQLGIWREVSLSWWMESFTNSVDGKPFNESPYYPGQVLKDGTKVIGIMDGVTEVNEVSIVSRGGQKGTSMSDVRALVEAARGRNGGGDDHEQADRFARYGIKRQESAGPSMLERFGIR